MVESKLDQPFDVRADSADGMRRRDPAPGDFESIVDPTLGIGGGGEDEGEVHAFIFIVVMGVSGTGKSTLGSALAQALGMRYIEGDDLHPRANVEKMATGNPLTDEDREPWLELVRGAAESHATDARSGGTGGEGVVISCSALKKTYRSILRGGIRVRDSSQSTPSPLPPWIKTYFVFIDGPRSVLQERMEKRPDHFMKPSMLESQLKTLENPDGEEGLVVVSLLDTTVEQVRVAKEGLEKMGAIPSSGSGDASVLS